MGERKERIVRVDDYIAEQLERQADEMPPSFADRANGLRESAQIFRRSQSNRFVTIVEES
jgi:hypothetical protein